MFGPHVLAVCSLQEELAGGRELLVEVHGVSEIVLGDDEVVATVVREVSKDRTPRKRIGHRAQLFGGIGEDVVALIAKESRS